MNNNVRVCSMLCLHVLLLTHVNRRDGAGGVARDELDVDVDPGEEIGGLGPEARPHDAVQRQPDGLVVAVASVEKLRRAPEYVELVRHATTTGSRRREGDHHRRENR